MNVKRIETTERCKVCELEYGVTTEVDEFLLSLQGDPERYLAEHHAATVAACKAAHDEPGNCSGPVKA